MLNIPERILRHDTNVLADGRRISHGARVSRCTQQISTGRHKKPTAINGATESLTKSNRAFKGRQNHDLITNGAYFPALPLPLSWKSKHHRIDVSLSTRW
jgi:hypothetical protein